MNIETKIWVLTWMFTGLVVIVCYQAVVLSRIMRARFGLIEAIGWGVFLFYRFYGMWGLSEALAKARAAGLIAEHLTTNQIINLSGSFIFIILIIISKHKEHTAIKKAFE